MIINVLEKAKHTITYYCLLKAFLLKKVTCDQRSVRTFQSARLSWVYLYRVNCCLLFYSKKLIINDLEMSEKWFWNLTLDLQRRKGVDLSHKTNKKAFDANLSNYFRENRVTFSHLHKRTELKKRSGTTLFYDYKTKTTLRTNILFEATRR